MSHTDDKFNHSRRLHLDQAAIKKQVDIARASLGPDHKNVTTETNRLNKRHAMDCGKPQCGLCGNPRHIRKGQDGSYTVQERRAMQDLEAVTNKRSNGDLTTGRD